MESSDAGGDEESHPSIGRRVEDSSNCFHLLDGVPLGCVSPGKEMEIVECLCFGRADATRTTRLFSASQLIRSCGIRPTSHKNHKLSEEERRGKAIVKKTERRLFKRHTGHRQKDAEDIISATTPNPQTHGGSQNLKAKMAWSSSCCDSLERA